MTRTKSAIEFYVPKKAKVTPGAASFVSLKKNLESSRNERNDTDTHGPCEAATESMDKKGSSAE
jgi:hypothetical protein